MPAPTSTTTYRQHPYTADVFIDVLVPTVILTANVNQISFTYPLHTLTIDGATGTLADCVTGQTVRVSGSDGTLKGLTRLHADGITSTEINIAHVSSGELNFEDNDIIEVLDEWRPQERVPRVKKSGKKVYKDYNIEFAAAYGDEPNPVCVAGPHRVGWLDAGSSYMRVPFDLTASYAVAQGATITDFNADIQDCTLVSGSINSGIFELDCPVGKRWLYFETVDSNGKTHTRRVYCRAFDPNDLTTQPYHAAITRFAGNVDDGWNMAARIDNADVSDIPAGALVVAFANERFGSTAGSISGYTGAEHVKFVGYYNSEQIKISARDGNRYNFAAVGPLALLDESTAFSLTVQNNASPSKWWHMSNMSVFKFIWHILYWHSTLLDCHDVNEPDWRTTYTVAELSSDGGSIKSNMEFAANAVGAEFTCDKQGIFWLRQNPQLMSDADRASVPVTIALTDVDWFGDIDIEITQRDNYNWLRGSAFKSGTAIPQTPYLSIAPGKSPSNTAANETQLDKQVVTNQAELNTRTGRKYALENARIKKVPLSLFGGSILDPAWMEWVRFTLAPDTNRKLLSYTANYFLPTEVDLLVDNENGVIRERVVLQPEVFGTAGTKLRVPTDDLTNPTTTPPPPYKPPSIITPVAPGGITMTLGEIPACYVISPTMIARTRNLGTDANYEILLHNTDFDSSGDWTIRAFELDSWLVKQAAYALLWKDSTGDARLYYIESLDADPGAQLITLLDTFPFAVNASGYAWGNIRSSINVEGHVCYSVTEAPNAGGKNNYVRVRTSYAGSFSSKLAHTQEGHFTQPLFDIGKHAASASTMKMTLLADEAVWESTDGGANWTDISPPVTPGSTWNYRGVHYPYNDNASDNVLYVQGFGPTIWRRESDGSTWTQIDGTFTFNTPQHPYLIHTYTEDRLKLSTIAGGGGNYYIINSNDGGDTWIQNPATYTSDAYLAQPQFVGGWPYNGSILFTRAQRNVFPFTWGLWWTEDYNTTWSNMTGDYETAVGPVTDVTMIIPVWVP